MQHCQFPNDAAKRVAAWHTRAQRDTNTNAHTFTHASTHTCTNQWHMRTHAHTHTRTHPRTHALTLALAHAPANTRARTHTDDRTPLHAHPLTQTTRSITWLYRWQQYIGLPAYFASMTKYCQSKHAPSIPLPPKCEPGATILFALAYRRGLTTVFPKRACTSRRLSQRNTCPTRQLCS